MRTDVRVPPALPSDRWGEVFGHEETVVGPDRCEFPGDGTGGKVGCAEPFEVHPHRIFGWFGTELLEGGLILHKVTAVGAGGVDGQATFCPD